MYAIASVPGRQNHNAGWLEQPHSFYYTTELCTEERYLIYKCLNALLYTEQKCLGILNPYAEEYFPPIEKSKVAYYCHQNAELPK